MESNRLSDSTTNTIILEQVQKRYGGEVLDNTMSRQLKFMMQLKNIKLNLGQAFLPIYNYILPALTNLAYALSKATNFIAQFMTALFGKASVSAAASAEAVDSQSDAVDGLGKSYKDAGKAAKQGVAGFDEVNSLSAGGAGDAELGGASGGAAVDTMGGVNTEGFVNVSNKAQEMANKVRTAFTDLGSIITDNKIIIVGALATIAVAFAAFQIASNWTTIVATIKAAGTIIGAILSGVALPITLAILAIGALVTAFLYFYNTNEAFRGKVEEILNRIREAAIWLWQNALVPLGTFLANVFVKAWESVTIAATWLWNNVLKPFGTFMLWLWQTVLVPVAKIIGEGLSMAFQNVSKIAKSFYDNAILPLSNFFTSNFKPAIEAVSAVMKYWWEKGILPLALVIDKLAKENLPGFIAILTFLWQKVLKPISTYVGDAFVKAFSIAFEMIGGIIDGASQTLNGFLTFITGVFTGDWEKAWQGVSDIFGGVFNGLYSIVKVPLNLIISAINSVISGLNSLKIDIPDWVPGVGGETWGVTIPSIPKLAKGGITNGPMTALIGDNVGGREVVSPLSDLMDMMTSAVGTAIMQANQFGQSGGGNQELILKIKDTEIARAIMPAFDRERSRVGYVALQGG